MCIYLFLIITVIYNFKLLLLLLLFTSLLCDRHDAWQKQSLPSGSWVTQTNIYRADIYSLGRTTHIPDIMEKAPRTEEGQRLWGAHLWSVSMRRNFSLHFLMQLCCPFKWGYFIHGHLRSIFWSVFFLLLATVYTHFRFYVLEKLSLCNPKQSNLILRVSLPLGILTFANHITFLA